MTRPLAQSLQEIDSRLAVAARRLVLCDYDGTLVPLAERPELAPLPNATRTLLAALAAAPHTTVGVVSGRALDDVRSLVDLPELLYAGNHGLQIAGPGLHFVQPEAARWRPELTALAGQLERAIAPLAGAWVEDKGLTLAVHFRQVAEAQRPRVAEVVRAIVAGRWRLGEGHCVYDVRPPVDWHKGAAALWIAERIGRAGLGVVYLGDDRTDEDAFAALASEITIQVGGDGPTAARYRAPSPAAATEFLQWLLEGSRT